MKHIDLGIERYKERYGPTAVNVFDIGCWNGDTAAYLANGLNVPPNKVYCVDASPVAVGQTIAKYPRFNVLQYAVTDHNGIEKFNVSYDLETEHPKISSLRTRPDYTYPYQIDTATIRLDTLVYWHTKEDYIDVLKVDVEGCAYEVLEGLAFIPAGLIIVEAEHVQYWDGQHTYTEVAEMLSDLGYEQLDIIEKQNQSDSVWMNRGIY